LLPRSTTRPPTAAASCALAGAANRAEQTSVPKIRLQELFIVVPHSCVNDIVDVRRFYSVRLCTPFRTNRQATKARWKLAILLT